MSAYSKRDKDMIAHGVVLGMAVSCGLISRRRADLLMLVDKDAKFADTIARLAVVMAVRDATNDAGPTPDTFAELLDAVCKKAAQ